MDQNPYSAPQSEGFQSSASRVMDGQPHPWEVGEVLDTAWKLYKQHAAVVIGAFVVAGLVIFVPAMILGGSAQFAATLRAISTHRPLPHSPPITAPLILGRLALYVVQIFVYLGVARLLLSIVRDEAPDFGLLFSAGSRTLVGLGAWLLNGLCVILGLVLLIVPGIIIALGTMNWLFFAADTDLGVIDCIKASWKSLDGSKLRLFGFMVVAFFLNVAGAIPCGLGLLVSLPVTALALAIIFTRTSGRMGNAAVPETLTLPR